MSKNIVDHRNIRHAWIIDLLKDKISGAELLAVIAKLNNSDGATLPTELAPAPAAKKIEVPTEKRCRSNRKGKEKLVRCTNMIPVSKRSGLCDECEHPCKGCGKVVIPWWHTFCLNCKKAEPAVAKTDEAPVEKTLSPVVDPKIGTRVPLNCKGRHCLNKTTDRSGLCEEHRHPCKGGCGRVIPSWYPYCRAEGCQEKAKVDPETIAAKEKRQAEEKRREAVNAYVRQLALGELPGTDTPIIRLNDAGQLVCGNPESVPCCDHQTPAECFSASFGGVVGLCSDLGRTMLANLNSEEGKGLSEEAQTRLKWTSDLGKAEWIVQRRQNAERPPARRRDSVGNKPHLTPEREQALRAQMEEETKRRKELEVEIRERLGKFVTDTVALDKMVAKVMKTYGDRASATDALTGAAVNRQIGSKSAEADATAWIYAQAAGMEKPEQLLEAVDAHHQQEAAKQAAVAARRQDPRFGAIKADVPSREKHKKDQQQGGKGKGGKH